MLLFQFRCCGISEDSCWHHIKVQILLNHIRCTTYSWLNILHPLSIAHYRVNAWELFSSKSTLIRFTYIVSHCIPTAVPSRTSNVTPTSRLIQPHFITTHTSADRNHELSLTVISLCCKPTVTPAEVCLHTWQKPLPQFLQHLAKTIAFSFSYWLHLAKSSTAVSRSC